MVENNQNNIQQKNNDVEYKRMKIITLGETDVGKTCFILKYVHNTFQDVFLSTVGVDYQIKFLQLEKDMYKIVFADTAGQEQFNAIAANSIKSANGIILMYNIANKKSFEKISDWMACISEFKDENFPILLVGNKCDLEKERQVSMEEGKKLAKHYNLIFMEVSNKEGKNVEEAAQAIINKIYKTRKELLKDYDIVDSIELKNIKIEKKKCSC